MDEFGSGYGQIAGYFVSGNESLGYVKFGEFFEEFLKTDCALWN